MCIRDSVKAHMETTLERIPVAGDALVRVLQGGKQLIRRGIYKSTMFEEMGFQYIGPIDGHDVGMLTHTLTNLRGEQYAPVFLHVVTKKGRGLDVYKRQASLCPAWMFWSWA